MDNKSCDQSEQMRGAGSASRRTVVAVLMAASLLLTTTGSTLAAGKLGGAGSGLDRSAYATAAGDEAGKEVDRPTTQEGKLGVATGEE